MPDIKDNVLRTGELGATVAPYVKKSAGDIIRADDWNTAQVLARTDIANHDHTALGRAIPREGIRERAIDGSRIDPEAQIAARSLTLKDSLKIGARDVLADLDRAFAGLEQGKTSLDKARSDLTTSISSLSSQLALIPQQTLSIPALIVNGNTGLGTASPQARLHVEGSIRIKASEQVFCPGRLHIAGDELLYVLNKSGMVIGKEWGGNGKLDVQGELVARGGLTFADGGRQTSAVVIRGGNWDSGGRFEKTIKYFDIGLSGFRNPPTVLVAIGFIDAEKTRNLRLKTWAENISSTGFRIAVQTWDDTVIYGATGTWLAFGS